MGATLDPTAELRKLTASFPTPYNKIRNGKIKSAMTKNK
jgi:hypothetical protein